MNSHVVCPECGQRGRALKGETLAAQLQPEACVERQTLEGYRFCGTGECDVVYFGDGSAPPFHTKDLKLPVFQKSPNPDRFVCYCFKHSVRSLQEEVQRDGSSVVPDDITAKCKAGLDACHLKNPQGVCCLGNVRGVVKRAVNARRSSESPPSSQKAADCCSGSTQDPQC